AQARALYLISPYRFTPHRDYQPVPLVPALDPRDGRPFDMSRCRLRGVSPVHRHYQENLGVDGAMSLSILNEGRLWGLVVGHHRRPHRVPIPAREQVMALTISLSMRLSVTETAEGRREHERHTALHAKLLEQIAGSDDFVAALMEGGVILRDLFSASSAAVLMRGDEVGEDCWQVYRDGDAPDREAVIAIARACRDRMVDGVFHTDHIPSILSGAAEFTGRAAGLLAVSVGEEARHAIIWFRPETIQTTIWGGATPAQVAQEKAAGNYLPRRSFARWVEERRFHSRPWSPWEIEIARSIHTAVNDTVLRQLRSIRGLNALLKERDEAKSRFLAHMSHKLRLPLNTVVGYSDMLDKEMWGTLTDDQREAVACIREAGAHLLTMINDILDTAKVETGKLEPQLAPTNLSEVVARMITLQVGVAHAQGVAVTSRLEADLPNVMVDERLVRQMLFNLLSNALKFTSRGGQIEVSSWCRDDGGVTLEVADTGIGIPKAKQAGVLEPFRQAHDHMKQGKSGTGLGLPIVKSLIELHGGRVELESEEGRGTAVRLEFPAVATLGAVRLPSVRTELRAATAEAHAALEDAPCLRRLFADDVSAADLAEVLGRLLPVYRALEARLLQGEPAASLLYRSRVPLLAEGLNVLGVPVPAGDRTIPALDQEAARWGALYVIEGATMGGQLIQRQLVGRLESGALSFFVPYGTKVGERWRSFLAQMEKSLASPGALEEAKTSALAVFGLFHRELTQ
ncbi:MAG: ATP-binding protein, partial [Rhodospirillaceae bacterium]